MLIGTVNNIPRFKKEQDPERKPRYFSFIKHENKSYFFHVSQFNGEWLDFVKLVEANKKDGIKVMFEIDDSGDDGKLKAKNVSLLEFSSNDLMG